MKLRQFRDQRRVSGRTGSGFQRYIWKADHNIVRRYIWESRRDDWFPCCQTGRSMSQLVRETLAFWTSRNQTWKIENLLYELDLRYLRFEQSQRCAVIQLIEQGSEKEGWELVLNPHRTLFWFEDIGHEIGHLEAFKLIGAYNHPSRRNLKQRALEEVFAEEFGLAWAAVPYHRFQARRLLVPVFKEWRGGKIL